MATKSARKPISGGESFDSHYRRFDGYATSLLATLSWCQDDNRRTEEIKAFVLQADIFLCELRARGEKLKAGKSHRDTEKIDSDMVAVRELLYQFVNNSAGRPDTLQRLRIAASRLYDKVITSRNAMKLRGHLDYYRGVWEWDDAPILPGAAKTILVLLCKADSGGMASREIINECDSDPAERTVHDGLERLLEYAMVEKVGKQYRLTSEGRKTADRLIRSK